MMELPPAKATPSLILVCAWVGFVLPASPKCAAWAWWQIPLVPRAPRCGFSCHLPQPPRTPNKRCIANLVALAQYCAHQALQIPWSVPAYSSRPGKLSCLEIFIPGIIRVPNTGGGEPVGDTVGLAWHGLTRPCQTCRTRSVGLPDNFRRREVGRCHSPGQLPGQGCRSKNEWILALTGGPDTRYTNRLDSAPGPTRPPAPTGW